MSSWRRLTGIGRALFRRRQVEADLDDELADTLAILTERYAAEGLTEEEARRAARLELGGVEQLKEDVRDVRAGRWLEAAGHDVRDATRSLRRAPALSLVVILSLAAGIGANTAVFSWMQAIVLQPIPGVRHPSSFLLVEPRAEAGSYPGSSWLEYRDLRARLSAIPDLVAFRTTPLILGDPPRTERAFAMLVSENYFSALGLRPHLGSFRGVDDPGRTLSGTEPLAVVSHEFFRARLGGDAEAVGRPLRFNGVDLDVVGVAPPGFQGTVIGLSYDVWVRAELAPVLLSGSRELEDRTQRGYTLIGRLAPGASAGAAQAQAAEAMRDLARLHPAANAGMGIEVLPFWRAPRGPQRMMASGLAFIQGLMALVLLAVCANTANLVLARGTARQREIGIRLALGAAAGRVVRLLLAESLLLGLLGAAIGVAVAMWSTAALRAIPVTGALPIRFQTHVDGTGLAVTVALGLVSAMLFGLPTALQLVRVDPQVSLRSGPRGGGRGRVQGALMAVEAGLATVVLVAAGLFFRSFSESTAADPGFKREGVLLAAYDLAGRGATEAATRAFAARVLEGVSALPGVECAAIARSVPVDIHGLPPRPFKVEGRAPTAERAEQALTNTVTPGYFQTMGIPFRAGSDFAPLLDASAPPQVVASEEFVRRYVAGEPLGRRIESRGRTYVLAGIVANSASNALGEPPTPALYFSCGIL